MIHSQFKYKTFVKILIRFFKGVDWKRAKEDRRNLFKKKLQAPKSLLQFSWIKAESVFKNLIMPE
jgi:hypothetical protein